jgi:hypothetical protein
MGRLSGKFSGKKRIQSMGHGLDPGVPTSPIIRACDAKAKYKSKNAAQVVANRLRKKLRSYYCGAHEAWHLTSRSKE